MRQGSPLSPFLFNVVLKFLARAIMQEEIKRMQIGQMFLFADDMILYLKDPKNSAPKLLDTIKSYSKVTRSKTHLQKSLPFYTPVTSKLRKNIWKQFHLQ
jgi:hypothetical protein